MRGMRFRDTESGRRRALEVAFCWSIFMKRKVALVWTNDEKFPIVMKLID